PPPPPAPPPPPELIAPAPRLASTFVRALVLRYVLAITTFPESPPPPSARAPFAVKVAFERLTLRDNKMIEPPAPPPPPGARPGGPPEATIVPPSITMDPASDHVRSITAPPPGVPIAPALPG